MGVRSTGMTTMEMIEQLVISNRDIGERNPRIGRIGRILPLYKVLVAMTYFTTIEKG
jgi:hypothetical protein